MDIAVHKTYAVFRTPFSETEDLVQAFSGVRPGGINDQDPVDYHYAALIRRECRDIWHADRVLALSTDEAPPQVIAGMDVGGNHAPECAVAAEIRGNLSFADIGTLWRDEKGVSWTFLRPLPDGRALFLSENTGPSETDYAFEKKIAGSLLRADGKTLRAGSQEPRYPMASCIRHVERKITALKNGRWRRADNGMAGCEQGKIREVYEIVNPVSAARALRDNRPAGGYDREQSLAIGDAMLRVEKTFTVCAGGTVVTEFAYRALQPIRWQGFLALMYQEKCCPAGGSVRRYIPGLKPFCDGGAQYDFSMPYDLSGPFPVSFPAGPDTWTDPLFPPDRQIEQIRFGPSGRCAAFTAGILPVDDGAPEIRRGSISDALRLVASRKTYLTFCGSSSLNECMRNPDRVFTRAKGTVYRKYYLSDADSSLFVIPHRGVQWLYADWMSEKKEKTERSFPVPPGCRASLHHAEGDVSWRMDGETLRISASRGYAVFALTEDADVANRAER